MTTTAAAAERGHVDRRRSADRRVLRRASGSIGPAAGGVVRDLGPSRQLARGDLHRGPHRRDQRGDRALPRRPRGSTGRCSSGATRTRCRSRRSGPRSRSWSPTGVDVAVDSDDGYTPTPAISHAILTHNARRGARADGIVITPSHNPPEDGGFKYNPPHGGPADTGVTRADPGHRERAAAGRPARRQAARLRGRDRARPSLRLPLGLRRGPAEPSSTSSEIARAGLRLGVDPLGGASVAYWEAIASRYGLDLEVVNDRVDPTFSFMPLDHDGKIRMDCSSPDAMAGLISLKDRFDIAFANDPDADRHGIVTRSAGLMNPNHYLAAAIAYLLGGARSGWQRRRRRRQDDGVEQHHRPGRARGWAPARGGAGRLQVVRARACSTARSRSAARRVPARASCAATAVRGAPTRTA